MGAGELVHSDNSDRLTFLQLSQLKLAVAILDYLEGKVKNSLCQLANAHCI